MIRRAADAAARHRDPVAAAVRCAVAGITLWSAALLAGPALRPDLDVLTTHPETYASGAWAPLMRLGYAGIALAGWSAAFLARRYRVSAVLLTVFAAGALAIGLLPPTGSGGIADRIFPSLQFAPLALLPAIAVISWRTRRGSLVALAALGWLLFLPLMSGEPAHGGIINRAADLALGLWIAAFAWTERGHSD